MARIPIRKCPKCGALLEKVYDEIAKRYRWECTLCLYWERD